MRFVIKKLSCVVFLQQSRDREKMGESLQALPHSLSLLLIERIQSAFASLLSLNQSTG